MVLPFGFSFFLLLSPYMHSSDTLKMLIDILWAAQMNLSFGPAAESPKYNFDTCLVFLKYFAWDNFSF